MPMVCARKIAVCVMASLVVGGCGSVGRFDPSPAHEVDLSGNWLLNRGASEDPKPILEKLRPKPRKYGPPISPDDGLLGDDSEQAGPPSGGGGGGGGQGGRGGGRSRRGGGGGDTAQQLAYRNGNEAYTHITVIKALNADLARAETLTLRQSPDRFSLDYGSEIRSFTPGAVSVIGAAWGVADQSSGWKGNAYVIRIKPQSGVASSEQYALSKDGKHLLEELSLGGGDFPGIHLKRVYDRADQPVQRTAPSND